MKVTKPLMKAMPKKSISAISNTMVIDTAKNIDSKKTKKSSTLGRAICASIRSNAEPHLRCTFRTKSDEKYCPLHLAQTKIIDYSFVEDEILFRDENFNEPPKPIVTNPIIKTVSLAEKNKPIAAPQSKQPVAKKTSTVMHEQKASTIENSHQENEDELEIKLLILVNDDEHSDNIAKLIGPVFKDITVSEDQQDPVTFDPIWEFNNGVKVPASVNKYYLFSYIDSKDKVRCLTIFTIYNMIQTNNCVHPITMEPIADADMSRAKELINLYSTKIGLFKDQDESNMSREFKLKNRITKLFKQFHIHSAYFEESWLLSITDKNSLYRIITETEKFVSNNLKAINPNLHGFKVFQR